MQSMLRKTALGAICLSLTLGAFAASAGEAMSIRAAQEHLRDLGYEVGPRDGAMGPMTSNALVAFQERSGLPVTGRLDELTAETLRHTDALAHMELSGSDNYYVNQRVNVAYLPIYRPTAYETPIVANDAWGTPQTVPLRFGNLMISQDNYGSVRSYTISYNGQVLLRADNQPGALRVSRVYAMPGEDAVVFTAYSGVGSCAYKNYLVSVKSDGSFNAPREVGGCSADYQARVDGNSLFLSFPSAQYTADATRWDSWRYGNNALVRI